LRKSLEKKPIFPINYPSYIGDFSPMIPSPNGGTLPEVWKTDVVSDSKLPEPRLRPNLGTIHSQKTLGRPKFDTISATTENIWYKGMGNLKQLSMTGGLSRQDSWGNTNFAKGVVDSHKNFTGPKKTLFTNLTLMKRSLKGIKKDSTNWLFPLLRISMIPIWFLIFYRDISWQGQVARQNRIGVLFFTIMSFFSTFLWEKVMGFKF
jgi:hypothetical protein